jgi:cathepsin B
MTVYTAKKAKQISGVSNIQNEISTNGPVQAAFNVYQDFFNYKSGVYKHVSGGLAGGHAIKIVGWGQSGSEPYWIVANSWGTSWGIDGFFWILRGHDECVIEYVVWGGLAAN